MGLELAKAYVVVRADTSRLTGDLNKTKSGIMGKLRGLAGAMSGVFAAVGAGSAIMGFMRMARAGESFNAKMRNSLAIMGDVSQAMRVDMKNAAFAAARATQFSAAQAAEAFYFLASAGLDAKQSIAALPQVSMFAQAGITNLQTATSLLTDAQSALGMKSKDAVENMENMRRISDMLVKANTLADASVLEFSQALAGPLAGALRSNKRPLAEGIALLTLLAERGQKGAEASRRASILYRDIPRAFAKNKGEFHKYGLSIADASGKMLPMPKIIDNLTRSLSGLSDVKRAEALDKMGLTRGVADVIKKLFEGGEELRVFQKELEKAGGTTKDVAEKQMTPFQKGWAVLTAEVTRASASLMDLLGPSLEFLMKSMGNMFRVMSMTTRGFARLNAATGNIIPITIILTGAVYGLSLAFEVAAMAVRFLSVAIRVAMAKTVVLLPFVLMAAAVASLIMGIQVLVKSWKSNEDMNQRLSKSMENLTWAWKRIKQAIEIVAKAVGDLFKPLWEQFGLTFTSISDGLLSAVGLVADFAVNASEWVLAFLQNWKAVWENLGGFVEVGISYLYDMLRNFFIDVFPQLVGYGIRKAFDFFVDLVKKIGLLMVTLAGVVATTFSKIPEMVKAVLIGGSSITEALMGAVGKELEKAGDAFTKGLAGEPPDFSKVKKASERHKNLMAETVAEPWANIVESKRALEKERAGTGAAGKDKEVVGTDAVAAVAKSKTIALKIERASIPELGIKIQDLLFDKEDTNQVKMVGLLEKGNAVQTDLLAEVKKPSKGMLT